MPKIENIKDAPNNKNSFAPNCALSFPAADLIKLGHGSGGTMSANLLNDLFLPLLGNDLLNQLDDATVCNIDSSQIAMTIDSYVVNPIFFPGGNIGSLSIHGTINDLSMRGAIPLYISGSFILEEGLPISDLNTIIESMKDACAKSKVLFVAGDTKVVNRGAADKIFITTCGIGIIKQSPSPSATRASVGETIIVSGDLGLHGTAIMCARENFALETSIESDSAPLNDLVQEMLKACPSIKCMRDITRGGLATVLNELASAANIGIYIEEQSIPIDPQVASICALLGLDPLYVACEGRLLTIVPENDAKVLLSAMHKHPLGQKAKIIGKTLAEHPQRVILKSSIGGERILDKLTSDQLPRIC